MKPQRDVPLSMTIIIVAIAVCYKHFDNLEKQALHDFLAKNPDFLLIKVMEEDKDCRQRLIDAYSGNRGDVVGTFEDRTFYQASADVQVAGLPQVKILDTFPYSGDASKSGEEGIMPIYRCFKGPNAWERFRAWLREEGYYPDFGQDVIRVNDINRKTNEFIATKEDSYISFQAFFVVGEKVYLWDGFKVTDLSPEFDREGRAKIARWKRLIDAYAQLGE